MEIIPRYSADPIINEGAGKISPLLSSKEKISSSGFFFNSVWTNWENTGFAKSHRR
jgi:hypothetical protein